MVVKTITVLLLRDKDGTLRGLSASGRLDLDPEEATGKVAVAHMSTRLAQEDAGTAPIFEHGEGGTQCGPVWIANLRSAL